MFTQNLSRLFNRGISTKVGIFIVVLVALLAGGIFAWQYFGVERQLGEIDEQKRGEEIDTLGWQTYRNEEFGFVFKYPKDWAAIESASPGYPYLVFVTLGPQKTVQQGGFFAVTIRDQTKVEYLSSLTQEDFYIISQIDTILGGKKATIYTSGRTTGLPGIRWEVIITQKDDFLLELSKGSTSSYEDVFNQILSTFKFLE